MGVKLAGDGFRLTEDERLAFIANGAMSNRLPRLIAGRDVTRRSQGRYVIDAFGMSEAELREQEPVLYQHLANTVKPRRQTLKRKSYRDLWWIFAEPRPAMRNAIRDLDRVIVTSEVSKHPTFVFEDTNGNQFDGSIIVLAFDDAAMLGFLSSKFHSLWKHKAGGTLEDRPRYQSYDTFDPFPFPADVPDPLKDEIRAEAEALDALRKQVLTEHDDLTLTKLYNVLEALREGRALTEAERDIHDRGLVTLIYQHHDTIDLLVAQAYGWPAGLSDEDILTRLVALNKERAAEEAKGLIRWLRPEYQAPDYQAPVSQALDFGEAAAVAPDNVLPWPDKLPEQVSAVAAVLSASPIPLAPQDVARFFKGKRAATVKPVLDAITAIGQARRLKDGRFAA
jgi:hypothetical protein